MHPDQFVLLNAPAPDIVTSSIRELEYHATVLDSLSLDTSAKIQIHAGGVYDDKRAGMRRFAESFRRLDSRVRRRLVVENDDMRYTLSECLALHEMTGAPVLLDTFHHEVNCSGEGLGEALRRAGATWSRTDGPPMIDYSSQEPGHKRGTHVREIDSKNFRRFLGESSPYDFDIMLEIKDKERSALAAVAMAAGDPRFVG
jgi:UV DNA damage endonuclease